MHEICIFFVLPASMQKCIFLGVPYCMVYCRANLIGNNCSLFNWEDIAFFVLRYRTEVFPVMITFLLCNINRELCRKPFCKVRGRNNLQLYNLTTNKEFGS